jgi:hypothetical protein
MTTLLAVLLIFSESTWCRLGQAIEAQSEHVRLVHNVLLSSSQGRLHSVSFTYSFPGRQFVVISGLGRMPSTGDLQYVTPDELIVFSDTDGRLLKILDLKDATQPMGASTPDTPAIRDFPERFRVGFWRNPASFPDHALRVLNQRCTSGLQTATSIKDEYFLVTEYQPLTNLSEGLFGQIAVLVSHEKAKGDESPFKVRWKVREKRRLTRWRDQVSDETNRAAENFVASLVAVLQSADGNRQ